MERCPGRRQTLHFSLTCDINIHEKQDAFENAAVMLGQVCHPDNRQVDYSARYYSISFYHVASVQAIIHIK